MKKKYNLLLISMLTIVTMAASQQSFAQQAQKSETLIKWRQSAFQVLAWNSNRIKAATEGQFNKDDVIKAANTIAAIANAGFSDLFPPGTEQGKGWHATAVKSEFFADSKRVTELNASFAKEANELSKVAASGDVSAIKSQFGKLSRTCKACHDSFKSRE